MVTQTSWPDRLTRTIAGEIRRYRTERGLSGQDLADKCALLGMPIHRSVLANLENGRRPSVSVAELLVLAAALEVPPLLLVLPVGRQQSIEILPGLTIDTWEAARWWEARGVLRYIPDLGAALGPELDEDVALIHGHAHQEVLYRLRLMHASLEHATIAVSELLGEDGAASMLDQMNKGVRGLVLALRDVRISMRDAGLIPPPLPESLTFVDSASAL